MSLGGSGISGANLSSIAGLGGAGISLVTVVSAFVIKMWAYYATDGADPTTWADMATGGPNQSTWQSLEA